MEMSERGKKSSRQGEQEQTRPTTKAFLSSFLFCRAFLQKCGRTNTVVCHFYPSFYHTVTFGKGNQREEARHEQTHGVVCQRLRTTSLAHSPSSPFHPPSSHLLCLHGRSWLSAGPDEVTLSLSGFAVLVLSRLRVPVSASQPLLVGALAAFALHAPPR